MKAALVTPLPMQEYLEGEQRSEIRHEYVAGQVYAEVDLPKGKATA
ncbi:hypothetical protein MQE22_11395 [Acidithiobacillus sp. YTS05]|nr:hypothetical protein [Igneacidithiobacillus copahuensis]UTV80606.1 hypothetical protein MQE22_11395 [Acidithiobacillus sp. YTS05]